MLLASIPSPEQGVWYVGGVPIRAYALCIVAGVVVALWLGERRWQARGGPAGTVYDVAVWAIPFGLVGARLYHVVTTPDLYFGDEGSLVKALYVWQGGLGIWGAVALGALGAWIGCRRAGVRLTVFGDAVAPGIVLAQAIGRWGNWFNQELFGSPTDRPWGLEIDILNRPPGYEQFETFHPTFLYESLWDIGVAVVVILADRWWRLGHGRVFALYVAAYTLGRVWVEDLRIDDALHVGPFRLNVWTSLIIFVLAVVYLVVVGRLRPGRDEDPWLPGRAPAGARPDGDSDTDSDDDSGDSASGRSDDEKSRRQPAHSAASAADGADDDRSSAGRGDLTPGRRRRGAHLAPDAPDGAADVAADDEEDQASDEGRGRSPGV